MLNIDTTTDGHVHTSKCHHASGSMEEYVESAIKAGLKKIIFLEHFETGIDYFESTWLSKADFLQYFEEGALLKKQYASQIIVGLGVEVGFNPDRIDEINSFLSKFSWDRIGISYHFLAYQGKHINMLSRKQVNLDQFSQIGIDHAISCYLDDLLLALKHVKADVLCHLDAALRHHQDVRFNSENELKICKILEEIAARGIALEVNTSGYAHRNSPYPALWIIKKAKDLQIKLVPGSDAHHPKDVGRCFNRLEFLN